jgi:ribulose-phosphate 3-epimerase
MIIAPSILSADFLRLGEEIHEAEAAGADWIHVDVMDGHFVPNLSMGPFVVEACRRATELPLDVHLMIEKPGDSLKSYADAGADRISVHVEATEDSEKTLNQIRALGVQSGIALSPSTPAEAIDDVLDIVDLILVMTVNPGFSGQRFMNSMLPKVQRFDALRTEGKTSALIEVDGGISAATAPSAAQAGADVFVAASAIFKHVDGTAGGVRALREALNS